jgi:hypothetical protein
MTGVTKDRLPEPLLLVALVAYLSVWTGVPRTAPDTRGYQVVAQDLRDRDLDAVHLRPPGYPLLLLATGASAHPTRGLLVAQLVLQLGAVYLLIRCLRRLAAPHSAVVALTVLLVLPPSVEPATSALTESLCTFLLVAAFATLAGDGNEMRRGSLAGIAIACAALTRPTYQLLATALVPLVWTGSSARRAVAMLIVSSAIVGGFALSNYQRFGYFGTSSALGFNLSTRTVGTLERLPEGPVKDVLIAGRADYLVRRWGHLGGYMYVWSLLDELSRVTGLEGVALERYMLRLNLGLIWSAPGTYLLEVARSAGTYWTPYLGQVETRVRHPTYAVFLVLQLAGMALFWLTLAALFGAAMTHGLRAVPRSHLRAFVLAVAIVLYTMLISIAIDIGDPRYRVPTDPLILLCAVLGTCMWSAERASVSKP